jgi:uncharacterized membrane protein HdeD (DUF308 family)
MGSIMELPIAASRSRSLSWRTGPFVCLAGAMTILLGCLLPHSRIHADNRPYGGMLQSVTYDGLQSVPRAVILLAVLAAILAAVSLGTGRRLRGGWWVVAIGALGTCLIEVVAVLNPTNTLMNSMVQDGIDEGIARELLDRGLYSVEWMIGVWFIVAGVILTFAGAILAIRRFRRCELCRAVVRVDSYREHLNAEHPTGLETP